MLSSKPSASDFFNSLLEGLSQIFSNLIAATPDEVQNYVLDIVFVHGLGGDRIATWQHSDETFWPRWLSEDFPKCRVFVAGYETSKFASLRSGGGASVQDLAGSLVDEISVIERPAGQILLIAHSLGGLVAKQMLRRCSDTVNDEFRAVGRAVKAVVFMGTPHAGAQLATTMDSILRNYKSTQTKQLSYADEALIDLNEFFRNYASQNDLKIKVYYETKKTWGIQVVDRVTANPNVLGVEPIAIEADHICICKPESRDDKLYKSVSSFVRQLVENCETTGNARIDNNDAGRSVDDGVADLEIGHVSAEMLNEFEYFTTVAEDDRRSLEQKLGDAKRKFQIRPAKRAKERFAMALQRNIAQPSAVARYTRLMADVESRYNRHILKIISSGGNLSEVDAAIQKEVLDPCTASHSTDDHATSANLVDGALYYLAGNCHLAFDCD